MITLPCLLSCENFDGIYWSVAIGMSVFWGCYSLLCHNENANQKSVFELKSPNYILYKIFQKIDAFSSDFALSLIGWGSLYLLLLNGQDGKFENFDIFLGSVAALCITGYGFKIADRIKIG